MKKMTLDNIHEFSENFFLDNLYTNKKIVNIFLTSGIKLFGKIARYDENTIVIMNSKEELQMIYKHAISTIM